MHPDLLVLNEIRIRELLGEAKHARLLAELTSGRGSLQPRLQPPAAVRFLRFAQTLSSAATPRLMGLRPRLTRFGSERA